jgi:gliding motility-associated-like protein
VGSLQILLVKLLQMLLSCFIITKIIFYRQSKNNLSFDFMKKILSNKVILSYLLFTSLSFTIFSQCSISITVESASWGDETTWTLTDASGITVLSGGPYGNGYSDTQTLPNASNGPYILSVNASGAICDNNANYTVTVDGITVVSGSTGVCGISTEAGIGPSCLGSIPPCSPPVPGPSITANPNPVPCGASSELTATGSGGPYSWFDDPGGTSLIGTGPIYNTPNLFNTTTYYAQEEVAITGPSLPNSLTTTFADNNGQSGNMFDVNVLQPISVESFDVHISNTATIEVYHKTGSHVGFQNNAGAWTLIATVPNVPPGGPAPLNLNLGFNLAPGTHAFYVTVNSGSGMRYTNGTALGAVYSANADLEILQGIGNAYPFSTTYSPRVWNGTIHYNAGAGSGTCLSEISSVTVNVDPASAPPATVSPDPLVCGNSAQIEVTGSGGTINWYDDPSGNNLIFTGPIFNTPSLTNTTTYYYEELPSGGGGPASTTFNFTGAPQTFTVPAGVNSVNIEAWGAQGGTADSPGNNVNSGGYASGDLAVSPGDVLNIYVGGQPGGTVGGWNGGGNGFTDSNTGSGGGGASDVRVGGTALTDRVIVAGGGGGHASNDGFGGFGGGLTGGDWTGWAAGGFGGSQIAGGAGGGTSGTNGQLGIGGNSGVNGTAGTGGGGGYYGGGGSGQRRGAGGGSSFIGGVTNGVTIAGENQGNGVVIISYSGATSGCSSGIIPVTVNVIPITFTIASSTDPTTCGGSDGTITLTGLDPNTTYDVSWNGGAAVSITSDGSGNLVITGLTQGTYTDITVALGACSHVESGPVVLNDGAFTFTIASSTDPTTCGGSDGTITLTGLDPNTTYDVSWNGGAAVSITSDGAGNLVITGLTQGTYTDITAEIGGCSHVENGPVVLAGAAISFTVSSSTPPSSCVANDGTITLSGLTPGETYDVSWNGNAPVPIMANGSGNIIITGLGNGTYTNFVVALGGCSDSSMDEVIFNTTTGGPIVIAPADDIVCLGDEVTLSAFNPNGATLTWSGGVTNGVPFTPPLGVNTYTVTGELGGCTTVDNVTIEVIIPPDPGVLSGPSNLCVGSTGTYTSTVPGGVWSPAPASNATIGPTSGIATGQNPGPVFIIYTVSIGSCTNANILSVTIDPLPPIPTITSNSPVCEGEDVVFEINGGPNNIITYNIDGGSSQTITLDGSGNGTIPPYPAVLPSTTLSLTFVQNANCSRVLAPVVETVIVNPQPALPTISSNSPICDGDQAEFIIEGTPGLIVNYELNGVAQSETIPPSGTLVVNSTATPSSEILELISVDDGVCTNVNTTIPQEIIIVNPLPVPPTITNNSPICEGEFAEFIINGTPDLEVTFTINGGASQTVTIPPSGSFNVPPITAVLPDVTLEVIGIQDALCSSNPTITPSVVVVNPLPNVPTISVSSPVCEGDEIIYTINGDPNDVVTYQLDGGTAQTIVLDGAGEGILPPVTATLPQSLLELIEVENANCNLLLAPVSALVIVDPLPQVPTVSTNSPVCEGDDAIFTIEGLPGDEVTYTINGGAPVSVIFPPSGEVVVTVNNALVDQTIVIEGISNGNCALNAAQIGISVTIDVIGITPTLTSNSPICVGDDAIFTISGEPGEIVTYSINGGPTQTVVLDINGEAVITENNALSDVTMELISVEDPAGLCVNAPLNITETVIVQPILPVLSSISPICEGDPAEFFISGDPGLIVTYTINGGAPQTATIPGSGTYAVPTVIATPPTMELIVTFLDDGVCQLINPPLAPEVIVVNQQPTAPLITAPSSICEDDVADFTVTGSAGTNFTYNMNGGASISETIPASGEVIIPATPIAVPSVTLNITAYDNGNCFQTNLISQTITINPTPNLPSVVAPSTICEGDVINFVLTGNAGDIITYNINGGTNMNVSLPASGTEQINIVGSLPQVVLNIIAVDDGTCINNNGDTHTVTVIPLPVSPSVTTNSPVCEGELAEFVVQGNVGNTINYELNGGASQTETFGPSGEIIITSTATIPSEILLISDVSDAQCSNNINLSTTIVVNPTPNAPTVTNNSPICGGQNAEFDITGEPGEIISYSINGGVTQTIVLNSSGSGTVIIPNAQTNQLIEITLVDDGTCQLSTSLTSEVVIVAPTPTVTVSTPICEGQNAIFNIQGNPGDEISYNINGGATNTIILDAFGNGSVTISGATNNQTITITQVTNGSCTNSLNISETITVLPLPVAPILTASSPICAGQDAIFELSGMLAGDIITYSINGGASQQVSANANGEAIVIVPAVSVNQTITLLNASNGACNIGLTGSETIIVQPAPASPTISVSSPICAGDLAEFVINGVPGLEVTFSLNGGTPQNGVINSAGQLIVSIPNALVNQNLVITEIFDGNCNALVNITATILVTSATPQINAPNGVCSGDNIVFNVQGNPGDQVTYNINGGTNQTQTIGASGSFNITIPNATTQQTMNIIQTVNGSCINTSSVSHTVVISPAPTIPSLTSNGTICQGQDAVFTISGVPNEEVTYAINGGVSQTETIPSTGELEVVISAVNSNQNIELTLIDNNGCSQVISLTDLVTVIPGPTTPTISNNSPICGGDNASFIISGSPGNTVVYSINGGTAISTVIGASGTATVQVNNVNTSQTLEIIEISDINCSLALNLTSTVVVNGAIPTLSVSNNVCIGDNGIVNLSGTAGDQVTYNVNGGIAQNIVLDVNGNAQIVLPNITTPTTINLTAVSGNGCNTSLAISETINVVPIPVMVSVNAPSSICEGQNISFEISGQPGLTVNYNLNGVQQTTTLSGTGQAVVTDVAIMPNMTFTIESVDDGSCANSNGFTTIVGVTPAPALPSISNNGPICAGDTAVFIVSGLPNLNVNYTFNSGPQQSITLDASGNGVIQVPNVTTNSSLQIVQVSDGICPNNNVVVSNVSVNPLPQITNITSNAPICFGDNAEIQIQTGANNLIVYEVNGTIQSVTANASGIANVMINQPSASFNFNIIYLEDALCSDSVNTSQLIQVVAGDPLVASNNPICEGDDAVFQINGFSGDVVTFNINGGANQTITIPGSGVSNITVNNPVNTVILNITNVTNGACVNNNVISDTVFFAPLPIPVSILNNGPICSGDTAVFTLTGQPGYQVTYELNNTQQIITIDSTGTYTSVVPNVNSNTSFIVTEVFDGNCARTDTIINNLLFNPTPVPSFNSLNNTYCDYETPSDLILTITGQGPWNITYAFNDSIISVATWSNPYNFGNQPGVYEIIAITDAFCTDSSGIVATIAIIDAPAPPVVNVPDLICHQNITEFVTGTASTGNLAWFSDEELTDLVGQGETFQPIDFPGITTYYVIATENGCESEPTVFTVEVDICSVIVPEGFSPNGDGINDFFVIQNLNAFPGSKFTVFNRWGGEVYHSDDYQNNWDGTSTSNLNVGGNQLPEGTYYYLLELGENSDFPNLSGSILKGWLYLKP